MSKKEKQRCIANNSKGERCKVVGQLVNDEGFCPAHKPGGREEMIRRARKGGAVTAENFKRDGVREHELGPLDTLEDAQRWLQILGGAVAAGRITAKDASTAVNAIRVWITAEGERLTAEVVDELRGEVAELRKEVKRGPMRVA